MGFIRSCYIKKNTKELRKKLVDIGMRSNGVHFHPRSYTTLLVFDGIYFPIHPSKERSRYGNSVDCGMNEDMFLAIAAIRDDSDRYQWFICLEDSLNLDIEPVEKGSWQFNDRYDKLPRRLRKVWKKANIKEIVEHFKSEEE